MMYCCEIPIRKKSQREFKDGPPIVRHLATENTNRMITERGKGPNHFELSVSHFLI